MKIRKNNKIMNEDIIDSLKLNSTVNIMELSSSTRRTTQSKIRNNRGFQPNKI